MIHNTLELLNSAVRHGLTGVRWQLFIYVWMVIKRISCKGHWSSWMFHILSWFHYMFWSCNMFPNFINCRIIRPHSSWHFCLFVTKYSHWGHHYRPSQIQMQVCVGWQWYTLGVWRITMGQGIFYGLSELDLAFSECQPGIQIMRHALFRQVFRVDLRQNRFKQ